MSDRPTDTLPDLTEHWPDDPANEELSRLGRELFVNRPELLPDALERVRATMRREMDRPRRWRTVLALAIACLAIALGVIAWQATRGPRHVGVPTTSTQPAMVRDRFEVTLPPASPKAPDRPLIDLNRDKELFSPSKP